MAFLAQAPDPAEMTRSAIEVEYRTSRALYLTKCPRAGAMTAAEFDEIIKKDAYWIASERSPNIVDPTPTPAEFLTAEREHLAWEWDRYDSQTMTGEDERARALSW